MLLTIGYVSKFGLIIILALFPDFLIYHPCIFIFSFNQADFLAIIWVHAA